MKQSAEASFLIENITRPKRRWKDGKAAVPAEKEYSQGLLPTAKLRFIERRIAAIDVDFQIGAARKIKILQQWWKPFDDSPGGEWKDIPLEMEWAYGLQIPQRSNQDARSDTAADAGNQERPRPRQEAAQKAAD
jgi:hypothetical protein